MSLNIIDTHAHLYLCDEPIDSLVNKARQSNVSHIIHVATDMESAALVMQSAQLNNRLRPTAGFHPCYVAQASDSALDWLQQWIVTHKNSSTPLVAIGEIGLDYYWQPFDRKRQIYFFERQLQLAERFNLPVIIHNRKADEDIIAISNKFPKVKKVFHCFSSGPKVFEQLDSQLHYFSFTGNITYSSKGKIIQAIKRIPLEKIMVETDSPYLTPKAYTGNKNQPSFVGEVLQTISNIKGLSVEKVSPTIFQTSVDFFNITT